jgi:DNA-binding HxlR family transcriptional regulator
MNTVELEQKPGCINVCTKIIGEKWTALIIRDLSTDHQTFGNLEKDLVGISPRTLSQRLNKLEDEDIVSKSLYCEHPPRYKYALTKKGSELKAVLTAMADWGEHYL